MTKTLAEDAAAQFARDTAGHRLTVLHDDGLYRHLRFHNPKHGFRWFDIVTWPGSLAVRGDFDGGQIFTRTDDMFELFRRPDGQISPDYWAEKTEGGRRSVKAYSVDVFEAAVLDHLKYASVAPARIEPVKAELAAAIEAGDVQFEDEARHLLSEWERRGVFSDTWEWDLTDYAREFLWACHAIAWGIAQYDRARAEAVSAR